MGILKAPGIDFSPPVAIVASDEDVDLMNEVEAMIEQAEDNGADYIDKRRFNDVQVDLWHRGWKLGREGDWEGRSR